MPYVSLMKFSQELYKDKANQQPKLRELDK